MDTAAIDVTREMIKLTIILGLPILATALVVGLVVSIFQAVTQINEMTLTFVPKIVIVGLVTLLLTPWMIKLLCEYSAGIFRMMGDAPRAGGM
ncbi:MAG TPA: flagellar biosynthesis protein FliQ [Planctomycetota bacterium]|nr:flagellar biosynthesis protein FliQ [Planctomycetota bacterium]